jgi:hypothetical protein
VVLGMPDDSLSAFLCTEYAVSDSWRFFWIFFINFSFWIRVSWKKLEYMGPMFAFLSLSFFLL